MTNLFTKEEITKPISVISLETDWNTVLSGAQYRSVILNDNHEYYIGLNTHKENECMMRPDDTRG